MAPVRAGNRQTAPLRARAKAGTSAGMNTQPHEAESLPVHVAACAERYKTLFNRLERIEKLLIGMTAMLLTMLTGIIGTLLYSGAPWQ